MQFSTTPDGNLNSGELMYNSSGASGAMAVDYENPFRPIFIMNEDETNRIYYYCKYHRYMSGYEGHEGYMTLSSAVEDEAPENDYYVTDFFQERVEITPADLALSSNGYNLNLRSTTYVSGGTGTGSSGGFDIGPHFRIGGSGPGQRWVRFDLDLRNVVTLDAEVIRGNWSNGGDKTR